MDEDDTPSEEPSGTRDIPLDADLLFTKYENEKRAAQKALDKVEELEDHAYKLRQEKKELEDQVPGDDVVVIGPGEQKQLLELGALGEDGEVQAGEVQKRLQEAEDAEEELQAYRRRERRREVYEAEGLNEEAAEDILPEDLDFEVEDGEGDDEEAEAFVKTDDGRTPVSEYIEENFSKPIQNALAGSTGEEEGGSSSAQDVPEQTPAGEDNPGPEEPDEEEIRQQKRSQLNYGV
jgi:hypothetical protein